MKYDLVIFDWDGTVMDSAAKIVNCMQIAATNCGVEVPSPDRDQFKACHYAVVCHN